MRELSSARFERRWLELVDLRIQAWMAKVLPMQRGTTYDGVCRSSIGWSVIESLEAQRRRERSCASSSEAGAESAGAFRLNEGCHGADTASDAN